MKRNLTKKQLLILKTLAQADDDPPMKIIADRLGMNLNTLNNILTYMKENLGVYSRTGLIRWYVQRHYYVIPKHDLKPVSEARVITMNNYNNIKKVA